jgi:hypothetical protein
MTKKTITSKKIGTGLRPVNLTALERMKQPDYRYKTKGLS